MNTLDYSLNIKGEHQLFSPTTELISPIINSNNRIFEISCKSGSGKTFLLNLIAYALEANKLGDEYILPSLKESVSRYNNREFYELAYNINLNLPDGRILILEKKADDDNKIIQYENQPPINYHSLHKRVTVLYDVPSNPSERLNGVIKDLGIWNNNIKSKIKNYLDFLNELKKEFNNERNDDKITVYKTTIENLEQKIQSESNRLKSKNKTLETLVLLQNLGKLQTILKKENTIKKKIDETSKKLNELKRPSKSSIRDLTKLKNLESDFNKKNRIYNNRISELIEIVSSKKELYNYIHQTSGLNTTYKSISEPINFKNVFGDSDYLLFISKKIKNLKYFKDCILSFVSQEKSGQKYKVNESLEELLKVINKFKEAESISILESITKLKENKLKAEINKALDDNEIIDYSEISGFLRFSFSEIMTSIKDAQKLNKEILKENKKRDVESSEKKYNELTASLSVSRGEAKSLNIEKANLKLFCLNAMGISDSTRFEDSIFLTDSIHNYKKNTNSDYLEDISASINTFRRDISNIEKEFEKCKKQKHHFEIRLKEQETRKSGQYSEVEKENINKFIRYLQMTVSNLTVFNQIINDINDGDLSKYKVREDQKFMEIAGNIIAYSMDNKLLRSDGVYIGLNSYNLLNQSFNCDNNIVIQRDDVSTGLASANYLKQRIDNVKGDYVVILLDEIGNMSGDILKEVLNSIKRLEEEKRLVLALLTHPNTNDINIISH